MRILLAAAVVLAGALVPGTAQAAPAADLAPLVAGGRGAVIESEYVVVLKGPSTAPAQTARRNGGVILRSYTAALHGYAARLTPEALAAVRRDPAVDFVQPNAIGGSAGGTQTGAPWHLDRIDQRARPLNGSYSWGHTGAGVTAYVIDSGIRSTHAEFQGRVSGGFTAIQDGNGTRDCPGGTGHGTFVASEIGGRTYGVAKQVSIVPVRILNCAGSGTTAEIVAGMDWVAQHHVSPAVANLSIQSDQGATNLAMDRAAAGLINSGVITVLIAGNFGRGDCANSPKDPRGIITAGSTAADSRNTGFNPSSYGPCVTVFAPGADVTAAGIASDTAVEEDWSGTSMAAPLVAGTLAKAMQTTPGMTMAQAKTLVVNSSTKNVLTNVGAGSPNRLLYQAPAA